MQGMNVIKYKIGTNKKVTADKDYFVSAGENLTTSITAQFPAEYPETDGWTYYVVFKTLETVTLDGGVTTNVPKFSITGGEYQLPNTLIAADITHVQFRAENMIAGIVHVFESEEKLFPRIATSLVGVEGAIDPLPDVHITQGVFDEVLKTYVQAGTGIATTYDEETHTTYVRATGVAVPGPHASEHATGGLDPITPASIGAVAQNALDGHTSDIVLHARYAQTSGSANAYVATVPTIGGYSEGMEVAIKINTTNTGAVTLNLNNLGVKAIKRHDGTQVLAGDIVQNGVYTLRYNGTDFILQGGGIGKVGSTTVFDTGYDPSTKETPAGAQAKADAALSTAKTYTDTGVGGAKTYADGKASTAETNAKSYADGKFLAKSGDWMTGAVGLAIGTNGGLVFPSDPYGGTGDRCQIYLTRSGSTGEDMMLVIYMANDPLDRVNFSLPSNDGLRVNDQIVFNWANMPRVWTGGDPGGNAKEGDVWIPG